MDGIAEERKGRSAKTWDRNELDVVWGEIVLGLKVEWEGQDMVFCNCCRKRAM